MKRCPKCGQDKSTSAYYRDCNRKDGLTLYCKVCIKTYTASVPKDVRREYSRRSRHRLRNNPFYRAGRLVADARMRAKQRNLPCDITTENIAERIQRGKCEVTGVPFELSRIPQRAWCPSLDRINPVLGYTQDNIQVVAWIYNAAKGVHGHAEVIKLAEALCTAVKS